MTHTLGSAGWVLLAWIVAGFLSLAGALTYAEIGALFPKAGGEYVYLREAYKGRLLPFLYGWMRFWIASPGSIAAYAVGAATFISKFAGIESSEIRSATAVGMIIFFTLLNCLSVATSGRLQSFLTFLKMLVIIGLSLALFAFSPEQNFARIFDFTGDSGVTSFGLPQFGMAVLAALWAFDGWNNLPMAAGEVQNPERNVPRALILGTLAVLGIYFLINAAYFFAIPADQVANSFSKFNPDALPVATQAASTILGDRGTKILSLIMMISALGAMNGSILTGARVPYALAKDGLFPKAFSTLGKSATPVTSILIQGVWATLLALSGTFDQLTDYVLFASWIFYALVATTIFFFRRKFPNMHRPYRCWGYPLLPLIFVILAWSLVANTLWTTPRESLIGLMLIGFGIPAYFFWKKRTATN